MNNVLNLKNELQIDQKLEKIWSQYFNDPFNSIAPLYQEEIQKNVVTFLSLNPSLQQKDIDNATKGFYPHPPYILNTQNGRAEYIFFQKFHDLGNEIKQSWAMLDLLYERDSIQKNLELKYNPKTITNNDKQFLQSQIKLTFEILENLNPKVVVVSNRWTEKFIHSNLSDLGFIQELPNEDNNFIYRINGIPFITNESAFLGSRQHTIKSKIDGRRDKLVNEILRVINS